MPAGLTRSWRSIDVLSQEEVVVEKITIEVAAVPAHHESMSLGELEGEVRLVSLNPSAMQIANTSSSVRGRERNALQNRDCSLLGWTGLKVPPKASGLNDDVILVDDQRPDASNALSAIALDLKNAKLLKHRNERVSQLSPCDPGVLSQRR